MKPAAKFNRLFNLFLLLAGIGILCALAGCQSLPRSGFDPSGERLFESRPFADCPLFNRQADSAPPTQTTQTPNTPGLPPGALAQNEEASIYTPPASTLPGSLGASRSNAAVPSYGSTTTALPPGTHAVTTALVPSPTAGTTPVFADTGGYALPTQPVSGPILIMTPREQIAPLGSEVVLIASYLGNKDRLITNEKIDWTLEGVGAIEKFDPGAFCDFLFFDCVKAKKVTDRYAVTKTSQKYQTLDRGTADSTDDVHLLRGQTWISVNSMKEGTTHVTAFAPNMSDWSKRTDVGIIHWVDAQWVLPRLAIAPVGESRVLTTTVLQSTNGQPRRGWIVRYEILNGPGAGLGTSGAQVEEVSTDLSGQATTILTPNDQRAGTNTIGIQIIRPAGVDGDRRVTVGSETVRQTWSGNPNVLLKINGPNEARLGAELPYEITAENRSGSTIQGVIALPIPSLASYIRSEPAGMFQGQTVWWNVSLLPNSTTKISVILRQGTAGSLWLRPEFRRSGGGAAAIPQPTTPNYSVPNYTVPNDTVPNAPEQGAVTYPGSGVGTPPVSSVPANPYSPPQGASTFQPRMPLSVVIGTDKTFPVVQGQRFRFYTQITNSGTTNLKNVRILIPIPEQFRGGGVNADWSTDWNLLAVEGRSKSALGKPSDWRVGIDEAHRALLEIPSLAAGQSVYFLLEYPTITAQGHDISCIINAEGYQAVQKNQLIKP